MWRSLEEWAGTPEFEEFVHREFPDRATEWTDPVSRRRFLTLMGASIALAGMQGCSQAPPEKIVPYVRQPEEIVPGKPLFFATAMSLGGYATGVLAENHLGRPTKIEGNTDHPASLGATDSFAQASILGLYDPDRSKTVTYLGRVRTWDDAMTALRAALAAQRTRRGAGLRLLTETVTSPTLAAQIEAVLAEFPEAKWHQHDAVGRDSVWAGSKLAFGEQVNTVYRFDKADVVLSLDADFLGCGPGHVRYVRDFMARRRAAIEQPESVAMNRLYVVDCSISLTGAKADHRLPMRPSEIEPLARAFAAYVEGTAVRELLFRFFYPSHEALFRSLGDDLKEHRGRSIVIAGDHQPPAIHALAHAMNHALGNVGETVLYTEPIEARPGEQTASLAELVEDMKAGHVELLVMLDGNPVYTAPADFEFGKRLLELKARDAAGAMRPALRFHLSLYQDETSQLCDWHLPEAHYLESWGDARSFDGTATIVQPLIQPLYGGKSAHEMLAAFSDQPDRTGLEIVREHWSESMQLIQFEAFWRKALHDGVVPGSAAAPKEVTLQDYMRKVPAELMPETSSPLTGKLGGKFEIVFRPDPTIYDGRFANNGWLQELPKPITKLTWDNAALMSRATAKELGVEYKVGWTGGEHGRSIADVVEIRSRGRVVRAPIWIVPDHPDGTITLHLGYGRTRAGKVGTGIGFNAYSIRTSDALWSDANVEVVRQPGKRHTLACTQEHFSMENRQLVRTASFAKFVEEPEFANPAKGHEKPAGNSAAHSDKPISMYPDFEYPRYKWGMAINLTSCVGCNACVTACQAENNIPVVGKEEVTRGRELHWLRIDRYYEGDPNKPESLTTHFQPVVCMHCENAPCEVVCPVAATAHSDEGLNEMIYNRCVGTRYCSNNCPYKVRRFNFFQYADFDTESLKLGRNPDVTVRSRGVMEKCSYCVQRINQARITAEKEDRKIRDGEILTACQAVCPAQAITFGNLNDPESAVSKAKASPLNYTLLEDLNTRPRTSYLAAVRNPRSDKEKSH